MKKSNINNCNRWGTDCIKSYGGAMLKYIGNGFFAKSKNILSSDCFKMYGNKYVVKTNNYCTYNGKKVPRYRYINNTRYNSLWESMEKKRINVTADNPRQIKIKCAYTPSVNDLIRIYSTRHDAFIPHRAIEIIQKSNLDDNDIT